MTVPAQGDAADTLYAFFSHARLARVMSVTVLATVLLSEGIRPLIGWPGYIGVLSAEAVIMTLIVLARRRSISFARALPISLAVFLVWLLIARHRENAPTRWKLAMPKGLKECGHQLAPGEVAGAAKKDEVK